MAISCGYKSMYLTLIKPQTFTRTIIGVSWAFACLGGICREVCLLFVSLGRHLAFHGLHGEVLQGDSIFSMSQLQAVDVATQQAMLSWYRKKQDEQEVS